MNNFPICKISGTKEWSMDWKSLQTLDGLMSLDHAFLDWLDMHHHEAYHTLLNYRDKEIIRHKQSQVIMLIAPLLEQFWLDAFQRHESYSSLTAKIAYEEPVLAFRQWAIRALKNLKQVAAVELNAVLNKQLLAAEDPEHCMAVYWSTADDEERETLCLWLSSKLNDLSWPSIVAPEKINWDSLFPITVNDSGIKVHMNQEPRSSIFDLTDTVASLRKIQIESNYCIYCHKQQGDYCSTGFLNKKGHPEAGVKNTVLDDPLWGCPLDQHISEMNLLRRRGQIFGALATIMVENPLCCLTGHRICNDCSMACIYQKQTSVDIPNIETRTLMDILELEWGAEWYLLLMMWNPLRAQQYRPEIKKNHNTLVIGLGPAGIAALHYLWMAGIDVVGFDGLNIEQVPQKFLHMPLKNLSEWYEPLSERRQKGFGGVAEYGITVRWDKNFLTLPWIAFARRGIPVLGGIRFGGTLTVEDVWDMGFAHLVLALGAGLPKALNIPNSLAKGMRAANDFLMNLQLKGANQLNPQTLMDIRLPAVVIGGGLTSVDAATELQAYYIHLINRVFEIVQFSEEVDLGFWLLWSFEERAVLEEWVRHAQLLHDGMSKEALVKSLGGVLLLYRRDIISSPSYRTNAFEVSQAMKEGVMVLDKHTAQKIHLDASGRVAGIQAVTETSSCRIFARTILLAIGSSPNIAYEYEHAGTFLKSHGYYTPHSGSKNLNHIHDLKPHKLAIPSMMTSYQLADYRVSYLGDLHPQFHGSVVKALASAKKAYPQILEALALHTESKAWTPISTPYVVSKTMLTSSVCRLVIYAPLHAKRALPGHFFSLYPYTTPSIEGCPLTLFHNNGDTLEFIIKIAGISSQTLTELQAGDKIALMGPSGVRMRMDDPTETTLIISDFSGLPMSWALALQMKQHNLTVYIAYMLNDEDDPIWIDPLTTLVDAATIIPRENWPTALQQLNWPWMNIKRVLLQGNAKFLKTASHLRRSNDIELKAKTWIGSVHGPMQCMLKGICAQCWQWQIDPVTLERTKAVFACSWQDQPLELIDIEHASDRQQSNQILERLIKHYKKLKAMETVFT